MKCARVFAIIAFIGAMAGCRNTPAPTPSGIVCMPTATTTSGSEAVRINPFCNTAIMFSPIGGRMTVNHNNHVCVPDGFEMTVVRRPSGLVEVSWKDPTNTFTGVTNAQVDGITTVVSVQTLSPAIYANGAKQLIVFFNKPAPGPRVEFGTSDLQVC